MKNYFLYLFFIFASFFVFSEEEKVNPSKQPDEIQINEILDNVQKSKTKKQTFPKIRQLIGAKIGYFRPDSKTFRDIYSGGAIYGLEGTFSCYKNLYAWCEVDYFHKSGQTLNAKNRTSIDLVFIGFGLKYLYPINIHSDSLYIGIGAIPSYVHIHDNSPFLVNSTKKWTIGGVFKGGFLFNFYRTAFLDFFADYKYLKTSPYHSQSDRLIFFNRVNLSGFSIGAAIAFQF